MGNPARPQRERLPRERRAPHDVAELVIHDKAGEQIVDDLRYQAEMRLREDGIGGNILLFKNNTDSRPEIV